MLSAASVLVDSAVPLSPGVDESYNITASLSSSECGSTPPCATIQARTQWGAMRGLVTFGQLADGCTWTRPPPGGPPGVGPRPDNPLGLEGLPFSVTDRPRFAHRGLMVDTSRHFLSVGVLQRQLDWMFESKLNVLHVHLSDAQSIPMQVDGFPDIQKDASYSESATFSPSDLQALSAYALQRGILLLPEVDMPGHAFAFGAAYPNLTANCPTLSHNINNVPLSPVTMGHGSGGDQGFLQRVLNATIQTALLMAPQLGDARRGSGTSGDERDASSDGPDAAWMHLGGDEVVSYCWRDDADVVAWMQAEGWDPSADTGKLYQWFLERGWEAAGAGSKGSRTAVHWQDAVDQGASLPAGTLVQVWRGEGSQDELAKVLQAGYYALLSNSDRWYLNCGVNPTCAFVPWDQVYENEPFPANSTIPARDRSLLLGGEAVLFGEYADQGSAESQIWPRAAAVAERLWSPQSVASAADAAGRMAWIACRLQRLGARAGPVGPGFCSAEAGAGSG